MYGISVNTPIGVYSLSDVRVPLYFGKRTVVIPPGTPNGRAFYVSYPEGWPSKTDSPSRSLMYMQLKNTIITNPPETYFDYYSYTYTPSITFIEITMEDINRRIKILTTAALNNNEKYDFFATFMEGVD